MTLGANTSLGPFSTAQELSLALNRNELSAEELLMATVERIDAINPTVNAIVAIDVDAARKAARESDQRRAANVVCGPLDGITMTVKDSIAVEGFPATSGFQAKEVQARAISSWRAFFERFDALICPVAPQAAFPHNLSLPSVERELVVEGRHYPYWDHVIWSGALANFAYLPATARPITFTSAGLPMGIQIVGPYLEDRTPIHAAELMDDLFGGFVRPPRFEENAHGNRTQ